MYVAKVNDRGKATYEYMFDDQMVEVNELFSRSYYMKKSSDKDEIEAFCDQWNNEHHQAIKENYIMYCGSAALKGLLQAPALVVLYSSIVFGLIMIFGSEAFYDHLSMEGASAFGGILSKIVIAVYIVSAGVGLLISYSTYDNVKYKLFRSLISIITFVIFSPLFFNRVFFLHSDKMLILTIVAIIGCFFIRMLADGLINNIIRKRTEHLIREAHAQSDEEQDVSKPVCEINVHSRQEKPVRVKQHKRRR